MHDLLFDEVALQHEDDLADLGSCYQGHVLGDQGQHHRRLFQDPVDAARCAFELLLHRPADRRRGGFRLHQEVDEIAVATVGRDPSGRRVRLLQVPGTDQVGQLVTDGRRRERDEVLGGQNLRTDRHSRHGVVGDDGFQDLLLALVERSGLQHGWQSRSESANSDCTGYSPSMPTPVRIYSDYV